MNVNYYSKNNKMGFGGKKPDAGKKSKSPEIFRSPGPDLVGEWGKSHLPNGCPIPQSILSAGTNLKSSLLPAAGPARLEPAFTYLRNMGFIH